MRKKLVALLFMILGIFTFGKDYPSKNINLIVPFAAGGGTDAVARKLGSLLERELGQPVIIVNRTGGAGAVGMTAGSTSKKDGYTITMITREIVSLPLMKLSPITYKNFDLVSLVNMDPAVVLVGKDSKYKTFQDILDDAKARPEKVKFASTAKPNFYALAIENKVGVKFNHIPYNGAGEVVPALLGNHADFTLMGPGEAIGQIKSGQFRALGLMATERSATLPEIPTLGELGYNIVSGTWRGIAVPKGTDPEIVATLNKAIEKVTKSEDFNNFMNNANFGVKYLGPKDFEKFIEEDTAVIKEIVDNLK
ncbi:tripartite tricarboxylate transporter substrate binding protein [Fusobacterium perfoetens]|uniref:tripartite tricarboxylate transporter substrate binding protein n=1 Tax=Fusobacterium perfoetens TaxID=852 RepID=UPI000488EFD1|nr:tripartite tricarboxylate transporter substrate binding protein [Fusobacterium perfoetens]